MPFEPPVSIQAELKQLWGGGTVPPLTKEQIELSLELWRKIKRRKQREQQLRLS